MKLVSIHFVEDPGLWLSVRAGELALRQRDGRYVDLDRRVRVIVAVGRGFCVTTPAIRYCGAKHIELLISDDTASFVSLFAPTAIGDARRTALKVREQQFRAVFDREKSLEIAKAIVAKKVKAEGAKGKSNPHTTRGHRREVGQAFLTELQKTKTVDDVRHVEAQAAQVWWRQWEGTEIRFAGPGVVKEWEIWPGRYIGRRQGGLGELSAQFTARGAVHPLQAMLNFSITIVAARMTRAIVAVGLDPSFGFLHSGRKPGRLSLVWDAVEPHGPKLVSAVFGYAAEHEFERRDFLVFVHKVTHERTVRLTAGLAKEIATLAIKTVNVKECVKTAEWLRKLL